MIENITTENNMKNLQKVVITENVWKDEAKMDDSTIEFSTTAKVEIVRDNGEKIESGWVRQFGSWCMTWIYDENLGSAILTNDEVSAIRAELTSSN